MLVTGKCRPDFGPREQRDAGTQKRSVKGRANEAWRCSDGSSTGTFGGFFFLPFRQVRAFTVTV